MARYCAPEDAFFQRVLPGGYIRGISRDGEAAAHEAAPHSQRRGSRRSRQPARCRQASRACPAGDVAQYQGTRGRAWRRAVRAQQVWDDPDRRGRTVRPPRARDAGRASANARRDGPVQGRSGRHGYRGVLGRGDARVPPKDHGELSPALSQSQDKGRRRDLSDAGEGHPRRADRPVLRRGFQGIQRSGADDPSAVRERPDHRRTARTPVEQRHDLGGTRERRMGHHARRDP